MNRGLLAEIAGAHCLTLELPADIKVAEIWPEESHLVESAVEARRREFATCRYLARLGLTLLGLPEQPITSDWRGAPNWPDGVVGTITHTSGFRAVALALSSNFEAIGIDAEPNLPLPARVHRLVMSSTEKESLEAAMAADPAVAWERVLFSAKESIYKVWHVLVGTWLDFLDVQVDINPAKRTFSFRLVKDEQALLLGEGRTLSGRFAVSPSFVVTIVEMPL